MSQSIEELRAERDEFALHLSRLALRVGILSNYVWTPEGYKVDPRFEADVQRSWKLVRDTLDRLTTPKSQLIGDVVHRAINRAGGLQKVNEDLNVPTQRPTVSNPEHRS